MELSFEYAQEVGDGISPVAYHSSDNILQVFVIGSNRLVYILEAETLMDDFSNLEFGEPFLAIGDIAVEWLKLTYIPYTNLLVMWHSINRHRLAVWSLVFDISRYLISGSVDYTLDDPASGLQLTLANVDNMLVSEIRNSNTVITPGARINVAFRIGGSTRFPLGVYYIDRIGYKAASDEVSIDARNAAGKLLKDQTFNEKNEYSSDTISAILQKILDDASVTAYSIEPTDKTIGITFPHDKSIWDGIQDVLSTMVDWHIEEKYDGTIVIGTSTFGSFEPRGYYTFYRDHDCFERSIELDDSNAYAQVCVYTKDFTSYVIKPVNFITGWNMPLKKTLFVEVPENTPATDMDAKALELASMVENAGIIETFVAPIRPNLICGDEAILIEPAGEVLGTITQIKHSFGNDGYTTEFTVDSGNRLQKPTLKRYIDNMAKMVSISSATITDSE